MLGGTVAGRPVQSDDPTGSAAMRLGLSLAGPVSKDLTVPGIESQQAQDLLHRKMPEAAGGTVRVVVAAPPGTTLDAEQAKAAVAAVVGAAVGGDVGAAASA
ncbi:hypothetical protein ACIRVF_27940 [Kitasatospora sp. NPDC101157]|uniref:hypothetical protein n=1 Tax=Kitasatospora sp. NPDC101157 TaxID=3364098 RepID=UPI00380117AD